MFCYWLICLKLTFVSLSSCLTTILHCQMLLVGFWTPQITKCVNAPLEGNWLCKASQLKGF